MIGVRLGPWVIDEEVGRGGMGAVYRGRRVDGDGAATAAVKVLAAELAVEVGFQQRFQREIDILRQLDHPNITRLYDSGVSNGRYWFAMEFVDGPSYDALRDSRGRLPWRDVLELACQVAPALKHAHDRGVIHRDLKPSNLLRSADGTVKLTDFGIASLFASPHLTVTGGVIGTPEFLSPEQAAGKQVTRRSDLYSLGVVLYALVTGTTPFTGDPIDLLHKHRFAQFDRPGRVVPELHPDFDEVICQLLAKDPADRPGDGGVLFRWLDSVRKKIARQAGGDPPTVPALSPEPGREGPATMVSRIVREELEQQQRGGPLQRLLHRPLVLLTLFVLCVAALGWAFWPMNAATLYQRGAALMASDDPQDWEKAWQRYLTPLERRHPDHPYQNEVEEFRRRYEDHVAEREAARPARWRRGQAEGQWFYDQAMRLRRRGDEEAARRQLRALVEAFADVPSERPWVRRAHQALAEKAAGADEARLAPLHDALQRAAALEAAGHPEQAKAVRSALAELYKDDPAALRLIRPR